MRLTMMKRGFVVFVLALSSATAKEAVTGNLGRGEQDFRACASCHSLTPNHNMTGPSLAGVIGRKAGTLASFPRYSEALKSSGVTWGESALDAWLEKPDAFIPGSRMVFPGIRDAQDRADIIAYLKQAMTSSHAQAGPPVGAPGDPDLKKLDPENTVTTITYCPDTYRVTTADGQTWDYWERNLRFKTDSSAIGPDKGVPALFGAGMQGDRASVIFSTPEEISVFIKRQC
jgi:cytochrome c